MRARTLPVAGTPSRGDHEHGDWDQRNTMTTADISSLHRSTIEELAADSHSPVELVERLYRDELTILESQARIRVYLPLIVRRRVRDVLRHRQESVKVSRPDDRAAPMRHA